MSISISGDGSITGVSTSYTFDKSVSIAGTVSYEDVTSIDAVGIITAQSGIHIDDSIVHLGDTNTKIRFPEADNFTVECAGNERFRIKPTNDIAVFTGSNSGSLTIRNDVSNEVQIHSGSSDALIFGTGGENERVRITSAGNLLINSTTNGSSADLQVGATGASIALGGDASANGTGRLKFLCSNSTHNWQISTNDTTAGALEFAKSSSAGGSTYASPSMLITSGGLVGIGTNNPQQTLEVNSGGTANGVSLDTTYSGGPNIAFKVNGTIKSYIGSGGGFSQNGDGDDLALRATDNLLFDIAGSEKVRITSGGKIGINNSAPLYAMHFKNAMASTPSYIHMEVTGSNAVGGGGGIAFDTSASNSDSNNTLYLATIAGIRNSDNDGSNDLVFSTSKANVNSNLPSEKFRITSSGNVGINESSPNKLLYISGSESTAYSATSGSNNAYLRLHNKNGSDNTGVNNQVGIEMYVADGATTVGMLTMERTGNNVGDFTYKTRTGASSYAEHFRISSDGEVTKPNHPAFHVTGGTNLTNNSNIIIVSPTAVVNRGNHYSGSNGRFTAPVDGLYYHAFWGLVYPFTSGYINIFYSKNGTQYAHLVQGGADSNNHTSRSGCVLMEMSAGDYSELRINRLGNTGTNAYGSQWNMMGFLVA